MSNTGSFGVGWELKSCPRCQFGDIYKERNNGFVRKHCLQCGWDSNYERHTVIQRGDSRYVVKV